MIWQFIIVGALLIVAIIYIVRSVRRSWTVKHDCPSCDVGVPKNKVRSRK